MTEEQGTTEAMIYYLRMGAGRYRMMIDILKKCETNSNKVFDWEAPTFLVDGLQWSLEHWMKEWECSDDDEPFVDIYVRYINSETKKYSFEIEIGCCVKYVN